MKSKVTYSLFFICLIGVFFISFSSTIKLFKETLTIVLTEADFDDLEEDETEKKEIEEDAKLITEKSTLDSLCIPKSQFYLNHMDANSISMYQNIQIPPPKI